MAVLAEDNYLVREAVAALLTGSGAIELRAVAEDYPGLLDAGASGLGYLLKERISHVDDVIAALREVARGGSVLDPKVVEAPVNRPVGATFSPLGRLTRRE